MKLANCRSIDCMNMICKFLLLLLFERFEIYMQAWSYHFFFSFKKKIWLWNTHVIDERKIEMEKKITNYFSPENKNQIYNYLFLFIFFLWKKGLIAWWSSSYNVNINRQIYSTILFTCNKYFSFLASQKKKKKKKKKILICIIVILVILMHKCMFLNSSLCIS